MKNTKKIFKNRTEMLHYLPKETNVAELGVFKGDFSKEIESILSPKNLYLIDIFEGGMGSGDKDGNNMQFINLDDYYLSLSNYFENKKNVFLMKGLTIDVMRNFEDNFLDIVYIDASHEYVDVKNDLETSYQKVKSGGFILGHDYEINRFPGVVKAVNEFCEEHDLEISAITEDGLPSFLIKLKK